jgi:cation diffusion facilitator CzcD-associated flavoprotein CzcO
MRDGTNVPADVIITATGFELSVLGDVAFDVDGEEIDFADTITYRGMMFTGVPNLAWVFGYFRASWTLRADLVSEYLVRIFHYMHENSLGRGHAPTARARPHSTRSQLGL